MDIKSVKCVYSGKAAGTKRIASAVGNVISEDVSCLDLSGRGRNDLLCCEGDVLVAALPASGGRLSAAASARLSALSGSGAAAIAVVTCGEDGFGDALLELCDTLGAAGFCVVGAAAFVTNGCSRPDDGDFSKLVEFSTACSCRLEDFSGCCRAPDVPGSRPYRRNADPSKGIGSFFKAFSRSTAKPQNERTEPVWFV